MIRRIALALFALGWMLFALPARAQDSDPTKVETAKRLFREGNALRNAGDCEGALALYLRSKAIVLIIRRSTLGLVELLRFALSAVYSRKVWDSIWNPRSWRSIARATYVTAWPIFRKQGRCWVMSQR